MNLCKLKTFSLLLSLHKIFLDDFILWDLLAYDAVELLLTSMVFFLEENKVSLPTNIITIFSQYLRDLHH